jgi:hypothetical protein
MAETQGSVGEGPVHERDSTLHVPPPEPPDDSAAWYAPDVRAQYELQPGVVATIIETDEGFDYRVREPSLSPTGEAALGRVEEHFADANLARPLTREWGIAISIKAENRQLKLLPDSTRIDILPL